MKLQCCFCMHIFCNPEWDEMLDCDLALEETGKAKCYERSFCHFELEQDEKLCTSYLNAFAEEYDLKRRLNNDGQTEEIG